MSRHDVDISSPTRAQAYPRASSRTAANIWTDEISDIERRRRIKNTKVGDVISVIKDAEGSLWKDEVSRWKVTDHCWYALVQAVHQLEDSDERTFDGIWLYKPSDTSCAKMKYPYVNELFLSDNCTCEKGKMVGIIEADAVLDVVSITWHGEPSDSTEDLFVRQTYLQNERFVTLRDSHKRCEHMQNHIDARQFQIEHRYRIGQTVLVDPKDLWPPRRKSMYALDPYEITGYDASGSKQYVLLRRLLRRHEIDGESLCKQNELVYSNEMAKVEQSKIERTCIVRFYSEADVRNDTVPPPYNRGGTGNAFYITSKLVEDDGTRRVVTIGGGPVSLIQGFDPCQKSSDTKLQGLDLYCGGGNFGRGLEEGNAVHNKWAVDMDKVAIHTYYANLRDAQDTHLYFGSVNDHLFQALQGNPKNSKLIPQPGDVHVISAGSPCQGFSLLNSSREDEKGLRNQSMVASVAAYIDFYRPRYGLLENVLSMARGGKERDHDVLSQLICSLVGMGYQLSTFLVDAWSYGSPQSRSRIFVAFTAPGYEPISHPEVSHSHPTRVGERGLGLQANGQAFGNRRHDPTPFNYVSAGAAVGDLPDIGDGSTHICIPYPDHVYFGATSKNLKLRIAAIPKLPRGMNFWTTWNDGKGIMTREQRALFPPVINTQGKPSQNVRKTSKAWGRVNPDNLFSTFVVTANPSDARVGTVIHWDQNRCLTVMEGRRAQSFPDEEIIVGTPLQRMKIIGNSVDRSVALALGLALRTAWDKNHLVHDTLQGTVVADHAPTRPSRTLSGDNHNSLSTSPRSIDCSRTSSRDAPNLEMNEGTVAKSVSREAYVSLRALDKDHCERFESQRQEAAQNRPVQSAPLATSNNTTKNTLAGDQQGKFSRKIDEQANDRQKLPAIKVPPAATSLLRSHEDSYTPHAQYLKPDCPRSLKTFTSQRVVTPEPVRVHKSTESTASINEYSSQALSTKRPYPLTIQHRAASEKSFKAAKTSNTSSPSAFSRQIEIKCNDGRTKRDIFSPPHRNNSVNASLLSEKLQVILKDHVLDDASMVDEDEIDETDFNGISSSEDEGIDGNDMSKEKEIGQVNQEILSSRFSTTQSFQPPAKVERKLRRIINTSNRVNSKSPTNARLKSQCVIDLTSDTEEEVAKTPPRFPPVLRAEIPVRPIVTRPMSKDMLAANNLFSPYAQTYRIRNMEQARKRGPNKK